MSDEQHLIGGLTDDERAVMALLVQAWNKFLLLDRGIPYEAQRTFQDAIHQAQSILGQFALERAFPDYWGKREQ